MHTTLSYILKSPKNNFEPYTISPHIIRDFYIIEDLESPFLSAQIEIEDLGGWFESLPITGNEEFEIEILQKGDDDSPKDKGINIKKTITFEIFKIKSMPHTNKIGNIYIFVLVEQGFFNYAAKHFSKSYKNKKISDIVGDILKNQLEYNKNKIEYDVEETGINLDFIIPYWKCTTTLKYLTSISSRAKHPEESGYIFYSTLGPEDQEYTKKRFVSIATLLEQKPDTAEDKTFYLRDQNRPVYYINNIIEMINPNLVNKMVLKNGIKGKTYFGIDLHNDKKIIKEEKNISKFINESIFLGSDTHFETDADDLSNDVQFLGLQTKELINNTMNYKFRLGFEQLNKREIFCEGFLDRYVGKIINISEKSGNVEDIQNIRYSGAWLIKKIVHLFNGTSFSQKMTILKNSFNTLDNGAATLSHIKPKKKTI